MIRKRRSLRRQQPGLTVLHIGKSLRGHVFCTKQSYLHLWLVPLLASSNKKYYHQFHVSNCFHVHGLILIPDVSWDFMGFFSMFFCLFRFECFCCRLSTRDGLGHRWPGAAPGRVARHGSTSEAGRTEPGRGSQNRTGNRFGNDWFLKFC